jgi:hypothetical protein
MLIVLQLAINFLFYSPTLMLADFDFSIFINGIVIGAASAVSYIASYFAINKINRKTLGIVSFTVILILSFTLIFLWKPDGSELGKGTSEAILVSFFIISFVITMEYTFFYVYMTELFPTQVRVIGMSMVTVVGGVIIALADLIVTTANNAGFSIMIIFTVFSGLCVVISARLP